MNKRAITVVHYITNNTNFISRVIINGGKYNDDKLAYVIVGAGIFRLGGCRMHIRCR